MKINNISTLEMTHDEWLKRRFESIGASESGSILGINPWKTAVDVYYEKVDRVTDFSDNLNMWLGRELEPVIKKRFEEETGYKVRNDHKIRVDKEHSFLTTNLDGMVVGEKVPVEYKALGRWDGEIPDYYFSQVQHQMMVAEAEYAYFVVLLLSGRKEFIIEKVDRNDEFVESMRSEEIAFWMEHVEKEIPPEPETLKDVKNIYSDANKGATLEVKDKQLQHKISLLIDTRVQVGDLKMTCDNIQKEILNLMGENEYLIDGNTGEQIATWKQGNLVNKFNMAKFKEENPDLHSQYVEYKPGYRRFLIKRG